MAEELEGVPTDWRQFAPLELPPILSGAAEAFHEQGYHATSVRDIANRVGLTVPALYYHYGNKEGMLVALLNGGVSHLYARCRRAVADAEPTATARFSHVIEAITLFMAHRRQYAGLDSEI